MASNYTENYGLCQWEATDNFVRTEFNQDNARIDAALKAADGRTAALGHDLYNLVLQSYYADKTTTWKKALVFDGFLNKTLVASASDSLFFMDRAVGLCRESQGDVVQGYDSTPVSPGGQGLKAGPFTAQGYGILTAVTLKTGNSQSHTSTGTATILVDVNGDTVRTASTEVTFAVGGQIQTIEFKGVSLRPGDVFSVRARSSSGVYTYYGPGEDGIGSLGGTLHITPTAGTAGSLTTPVLALPDRGSFRAWVRFAGGSVALSAAGTDGTAHAFTALGDRTTVNTAGETCTERELLLKTPPASGPLAFTLDLSLGEEDQMELFDYGILLL